MTVTNAVLSCPIERPNDADVDTVGEYLESLLHTLWREEEGFSGKRPFGNSGWEWDVYGALVKADLLEGTLDEDGYVEDVDDKTGAKMIHDAIRLVFRGW